MENTVFKISEAVATHGGAMEADTISKHGRSSKSQMSRGYFLRKVCSVLLTAAFFIAVPSCDKDDDGGGGGGGGGETMKVSGTLVDDFADWNQVSVALGEKSGYSPEWSVTVSISNGKFDLTLPTPEAKHLWSIAEDMPEEGITVSDQTAKMTLAEFYARKDGDSRYILLCNFGETTYVTVEYLYVDKNVNITGTSTWEDEDEEYSSVENYNVQLKKGWNYIVDSGTRASNGNWTYNITANGTIPSSAKWQEP